MTQRRGVRWLIAALMTTALVASGGTAASAAPPRIDGKSKKSVARAYTKVAKMQNVRSGWTGSVKRCKVGKNSAKHDRAALATTNWARAQSGLAPVRWNKTWAKQARAHALVTSANGYLSHGVSPSTKCYSKAADTAGRSSNIAMGTTGPGSVRAYLVDAGRYNNVVGHRRWILDPRTTQIGIGSTDFASSMKVFGGDSFSDTTPKGPRFLPWPTAGYFPYEEEPWGRWSLSAPAADFSRAKVTVRNAKGKKVRLKKAPNAVGYGPNTIAWDLKKAPKAPRGKKTATYTVKVTGIRWPGTSGPKTHTYKVKLINAKQVAKK